MKIVSEIIRYQHMSIKLLLLVASFFLVCVNSNAEEKQKKIKPKVRMNYTKYMNGNMEVKARAYYKDGRETKPCIGATIGFYKDEDFEVLYKQLPTDAEGQAFLTLTAEELSAFQDTINHYYFFVRLEGNEKYRASEADMEVWNSNLDVEFLKGDSLNSIKATFKCCDETHEMTLCKKVPLRFYIKRFISPVLIGGDFIYTDEEGVASITFPEDIPGDENGNITVMVKLNEDDLFGTVVYEANIDWGVPVHPENPVGEGSLIGSRYNAPWYVFIGINAVLAIIWGFMLYIVVGLFKIKKIGNQGA